MTTDELGRAAVSLSVQEIEVLYVKYGESVLCRCRQLLRDESTSWDAMHQTFIRAIKYRNSYKEQSHPRTWLYTIATRVCLDEIKAASARPLSELQNEAPANVEAIPVESMEERLSQRQTVARLLGYFSAKIQQIVVLRYFDDLEVQEISAQTGLSERTVARRLSEFIQRSKRLLAEAQT